MTELLKGNAVSDSINAETAQITGKLRAGGIVPTLAIIRLGEDPGDMAYERGALKRAAETGIEIRSIVLDKEISQSDLEREITDLNRDDSVHGVLMFRPLPGHIDEKKVCDVLDPAKDVDGITSSSAAGVFMDSDTGFPPCTAEACIMMLDHYGYGLEGKRVTVMGRSLVIGKPVAMLAMRRNATVTVCHSRTDEKTFIEAGSNADIVIAAVGKCRMIKGRHLGKGQIIIDVGINMDENGVLCGDVDFKEVSPCAGAITPVPGGVGSITTAVLMKHVAEAAEKQALR